MGLRSQSATTTTFVLFAIHSGMTAPAAPPPLRPYGTRWDRLLSLDSPMVGSATHMIAPLSLDQMSAGCREIPLARNTSVDWRSRHNLSN